MTALLNLAERVEAATPEQQREMLLLAFEALTANFVATPSAIKFVRMLDAEAYESAAMTLIPEGYGRIQQEQARMSDGSIRCWASIDKWPASPKRGATPALALIAAALKARALSHQSNDRRGE